MMLCFIRILAHRVGALILVFVRCKNLKILYYSFLFFLITTFFFPLHPLILILLMLKFYFFTVYFKWYFCHKAPSDLILMIPYSSHFTILTALISSFDKFPQHFYFTFKTLSWKYRRTWIILLILPDFSHITFRKLHNIGSFNFLICKMDIKLLVLFLNMVGEEIQKE